MVCSSLITLTPGQLCRALYEYSAAGPEELSLAAGDELLVVDRSDPDWWKVEKNLEIFLVPASYVEVIG